MPKAVTLASDGGEVASTPLLRWLDTPTALVLAWVLAIFVGLRLALLTGSTTVGEVDFLVFHAASQLFLSGEIAPLFDNEAFTAVHGLEGRIRWLYPPHVFVLVGPLSFLEQAPARFVLGAFGVGFYVLATLWLFRVVAPTAPRALRILAAAPPTCVIILGTGHLTQIWLACLIAGFAFWGRGHAVAAGIMIGLATFKPSLGPLVLLAVLTTRDWRVILSASLSALLAMGLSTLTVGWEYWPLLLDKMAEHMASTGDPTDPSYVGLLLSAKGYLLALGAPVLLADVVQALLTISILSVTIAAWRDDRLPAASRIGILLVLLPMVLPNIWYYDSFPMALGAALLVAGGTLGAGPWGIALAILVYLNVLPVLLASGYAGLATVPAAIGTVVIAIRAIRAAGRLPSAAETH